MYTNTNIYNKKPHICKCKCLQNAESAHVLENRQKREKRSKKDFANRCQIHFPPVVGETWKVYSALTLVPRFRFDKQG